MDLPGLYFMLLSCSNVTPKAALMKKKPFLAVRDGFTVVAFDHRSSRTSQKGWGQLFRFTSMNYRVKMCKFGSQVCPQSPQEGLPQLAPWHHVGVTMEITLDKNGSFKRSVGNWVPQHAPRLVTCIYIWWHPSCARRHPGTVTAVPSYGPHLTGCRPGPLHAGTFSRVPGGVFVGHRPPPGPRWPLH